MPAAGSRSCPRGRHRGFPAEPQSVVPVPSRGFFSFLTVLSGCGALQSPATALPSSLPRCEQRASPFHRGDLPEPARCPALRLIFEDAVLFWRWRPSAEGMPRPVPGLGRGHRNPAGSRGSSSGRRAEHSARVHRPGPAAPAAAREPRRRCGSTTRAPKCPRWQHTPSAEALAATPAWRRPGAAGRVGTGSRPACSCRTTWRRPSPARTAGKEEASATLSLPVCAATARREVPAAGDERSAETQVAAGQAGAPAGPGRRRGRGGEWGGCCAHPGGGPRRQVPRLRRPVGPRVPGEAFGISACSLPAGAAPGKALAEPRAGSASPVAAVLRGTAARPDWPPSRGAAQRSAPCSSGGARGGQVTQDPRPASGPRHSAAPGAAGGLALPGWGPPRWG